MNAVLTAIEEFARTGEIGDGTIFATPVLAAVRIRTGEHGEVALSWRDRNQSGHLASVVAGIESDCR